jgi:ubiquinone/menaquinone biosynthesis C-methylase UbiE
MKNIYKNRIFPIVLDHVMQYGDFTKARIKLLSEISGHVVEIGFGTGLNLPFYGEGILSLTSVDPHEGLSHLAQHRIADVKFPVIHKQLSAEHLPFEDNSIDVVVSTWTLCSIPNVEMALAEIKRVLKPNGKFYFVEHGLSPEPYLAKWQHRLTPIQKVIGDGCHLDRDMKLLVERSGLKMVHCEQYAAKKIFSLMAWMTLGQAVK